MFPAAPKLVSDTEINPQLDHAAALAALMQKNDYRKIAHAVADKIRSEDLRLKAEITKHSLQ